MHGIQKVRICDTGQKSEANILYLIQFDGAVTDATASVQI